MFLRVIRQGRWLIDYDKSDFCGGDIQGDALCDLQTKQNKLSVYKVHNKNDETSASIAFAASRDNLCIVDYVTFEESVLDSINVTSQTVLGGTPNKSVNKMHYELVSLTVQKLADLARIISVRGYERISRQNVRMQIADGIRAGELDKGKISSKILDCL